jgi:hypothetical protein
MVHNDAGTIDRIIGHAGRVTGRRARRRRLMESGTSVSCGASNRGSAGQATVDQKLERIRRLGSSFTLSRLLPGHCDSAGCRVPFLGFARERSGVSWWSNGCVRRPELETIKGTFWMVEGNVALVSQGGEAIFKKTACTSAKAWEIG